MILEHLDIGASANRFAACARSPRAHSDAAAMAATRPRKSASACGSDGSAFSASSDARAKSPRWYSASASSASKKGAAPASVSSWRARAIARSETPGPTASTNST